VVQVEPLNVAASPWSSTSAQNDELAHEIDAGLLLSTWVRVDHDEPFHVRTPPNSSIAPQKVADGHET
jgi:hypothetical protein